MEKLIKVSLFLILTFTSSGSLADTSRRSPSDDGAFTAGPYYNSATQSYYELVRISPKTWEEAQIEATLYNHKGTSGHLATISRPETHMFIVRNFIFTENTWIGLQFTCEDSSLTWSNGLSHAGNNFSNWDDGVRSTRLLCSTDEKLVTFINGGAFNWALQTSDTIAGLILIEYPTGRE